MRLTLIVFISTLFFLNACSENTIIDQKKLVSSGTQIVEKINTPSVSESSTSGSIFLETLSGNLK